MLLRLPWPWALLPLPRLGLLFPGLLGMACGRLTWRLVLTPTLESSSFSKAKFHFFLSVVRVSCRTLFWTVSMAALASLWISGSWICVLSLSNAFILACSKCSVLCSIQVYCWRGKVFSVSWIVLFQVEVSDGSERR